MKSFKLLSLDVWDTLIRRKCHPDEIKIHTSNFLCKQVSGVCNLMPLDVFEKRLDLEKNLACLSMANGFDDEYTIYDVFCELLKFLDLGLSKHQRQKFIIDLIEFEVETEISVSYLDSHIMELVSCYPHSVIAFVSDFYMPKPYLSRIISNNTSLKFDYGFVSCDFSINKKTGKLFKKIHKILNINPCDHFHIGDNPTADVEPLRQLGGNSLLYVNQEEEKKRKNLNHQFSTRLLDKKNYFFNLEKIINNELSKALKKYDLTNDQNNLFSEGFKNSLIYLSFILHVFENVQDDKVFYFTREGFFFEKIHQLVLDFYLKNYSTTLAKTAPKSKLLEISRLSTFFISLRQFSISELMRIWTLYSTQSLQQLFLSLGLRSESYMKFLNKHNISLNKQIIYPWLDQKLIDLFDDQDFLDALMQEHQQKHYVFFKFLESKGISQSSSSLSIVDIGWRGSIQDNLSFILDKTKIHGIYLGLQKFLNSQPPNVVKVGYLSNQNILQDELLDFVSPIEMLCNAPGGSVSGYIYNQHTEKCEIQKKVYPREDAVFDEYIVYYQNGVFEGCKAILPFITQHALSSEELRSYSRKLLKNLISFPNHSVAKAYFNLEHNETFGVGDVISKRQFLGLYSLFKILKQSFYVCSKEKLSIKSFLFTINEAIKQTGWPQAYFVNLRIPFLGFLYLRKSRLNKTTQFILKVFRSKKST